MNDSTQIRVPVQVRNKLRIFAAEHGVPMSKSVAIALELARKYEKLESEIKMMKERMQNSHAE